MTEAEEEFASETAGMEGSTIEIVDVVTVLTANSGLVLTDCSVERTGCSFVITFSSVLRCSFLKERMRDIVANILRYVSQINVGDNYLDATVCAGIVVRLSFLRIASLAFGDCSLFTLADLRISCSDLFRDVFPTFFLFFAIPCNC